MVLSTQLNALYNITIHTINNSLQMSTEGNV